MEAPPMAFFDYQGAATLIASLTASVVTVVTLVRQGRTDAKVTVVAEQNVKTAADVKELAVNTNSIKDALVKVTGEKEFLKGAASERSDQIAREAVFNKGVASVDPIVASVDKNAEVTSKATLKAADNMIAAIRDEKSAG